MQSHLINIAIDATHLAGRIICQKIEQADLDDYIIQLIGNKLSYIINKQYPQHNIDIAGEFIDNNGDCTWFIEPISGLGNYLHGYAQHAITIAIQIQDIVTHSVIYDPLNNNLYTASNGNGARLNNKRIRINKRPENSGNILGIELSPENNNNSIMRKITTTATPDIRISGSPALAIAQTAAGQLDGFIGNNIPYNVMLAGSLITREAGGFFGGLEDDDSSIPENFAIAASRSLYPKLCNIIMN